METTKEKHGDGFKDVTLTKNGESRGKNGNEMEAETL